jgi:hypothetical protein
MTAFTIGFDLTSQPVTRAVREMSTEELVAAINPTWPRWTKRTSIRAIGSIACCAWSPGGRQSPTIRDRSPRSALSH